MPRTAASVSTRVVSWNEAAEMNDSVASEALVMPSSTGSRWPAACRRRSTRSFSLEHARPVHLLAAQEAGVARHRRFDLAQHLANDHLDVLVVDLHALQAVDVLDLAHQVVRQRLDALQAQDVVRVRLAVGDHLAALDLLALEHVEVPPLRDQLLVLLALLVGDDQAALALGFLAEADRARELGEDRRSFGLRASNRSATRGRPPVMSRVFELSCGMRAMTSPTDTLAPSLQADQRARGQRVAAGMSVFANRLPCPCVDELDRRTQVLVPRRAASGPARRCDVRPVTSSTWVVTSRHRRSPGSGSNPRPR
jgi:hypothetical protein